MLTVFRVRPKRIAFTAILTLFVSASVWTESHAQGVDMPVNEPSEDFDHPLGIDTHTQNETSIEVVDDVVCVAFNDNGASALDNAGFAVSTDSNVFVDGALGVDQFEDSFSGGDPSLAYRASDDAVYYASNGVPGSLHLWRSIDACQTFSDAGEIGAFAAADKPLMGIDNGPLSPYNGRIYVGLNSDNPGTGSRVIWSSDAGQTWSPAVDLPDSPLGTQATGMWPAVAPNGDVYFAFLRRGLTPESTQDQLVYRSTDGGSTWAARTPIGANQLRPEDVAASANCDQQALTGNIRYLSSPQIAIHDPDPASPQTYVVHAVYSYDPDFDAGTGQNGPDHVDVFYRRSTDGGATWEDEITLNDDGGTTDQFFPTLDASSAGVVAASWYDRRVDPAANMKFALYAAVSYDGGLTWTPNFRVSDADSPVVIPTSGVPGCYHGDYDQIEVESSVVHFVWADDRRGDADVYYDQLGA